MFSPVELLRKCHIVQIRMPAVPASRALWAAADTVRHQKNARVLRKFRPRFCPHSSNQYTSSGKLRRSYHPTRGRAISQIGLLHSSTSASLREEVLLRLQKVRWLQACHSVPV